MNLHVTIWQLANCCHVTTIEQKYMELLYTHELPSTIVVNPFYCAQIYS